MTSFLGARRAVILAAVLLSSACGGTDDDDGPTGNTGSFTIAVSPTSNSVAQGNTVSFTVTVARTGGFDGVVGLTISGAPNGVSATVNPAQVPASATTAQIDVTVSATAALVTSSLTITGSSGGRQASAGFALTVLQPSNYTLTLSPNALGIMAGTVGNAFVNIVRNNFPGDITLALLNPPPGVVASFDPSPSPTNTAILAVAVAASAAPGVYPVTIRGSGTGVPERTVQLLLTIIPAPAGTRNVDYSFCDPANAPMFVAYQDGTGGWQQVPEFSSGGVVRFLFNLASSRGGVLAIYRSALTLDALDGGLSGRTSVVRQRSRQLRRSSRLFSTTSPALIEWFYTEVLFATAAELAQDAANSCNRTLPTKTVSGTVLGVSPGQYGVVSLGSAGTIYDGAASTNPVVFEGVQSGRVDFVGARIVTPGLAPDRGLVFRNLNPANGGQLPQPIDFNGPASFPPATATVTITGGLGDRLEVYSVVHTANSSGTFWSDLAPSVTTTRPWAGLNSANTVSGDFHELLVFASAQVPDNFRATSRYVGPISDQSIAFGPVANPATTSVVSAGAYPRYRFQGTIPAEYDRGIALSLFPEDEGNSFTAFATSAYLAASGSVSTYDVAMPDVTGLADFPMQARVSGGPNFVVTDVFGFTGTGIIEPVPAVGGVFRASVRTTTIVVP